MYLQKYMLLFSAKYWQKLHLIQITILTMQPAANLFKYHCVVFKIKKFLQKRYKLNVLLYDQLKDDLIVHISVPNR